MYFLPTLLLAFCSHNDGRDRYISGVGLAAIVFLVKLFFILIEANHL